jgi:hypothetical protein
MTGDAGVDWPSLLDSGWDISEPGLQDPELDGGENLFSSQLLSCPAKVICDDNSKLAMNPKHQEAKGDGKGEAEQGSQVAREY